ncbi:MAG: HlyC/CorC family transporter, partial [Deltaproteobacteria bacterium]
MGPEIVILIALLALSGFFSSAETALFSISRSKVKFLAKKGNRFDLLIKKMK